jgi:hypothetical protein
MAPGFSEAEENFQLADVFGADCSGERIEAAPAVQMNVREPQRFPFRPWENPSVTVNQSGLVVKARGGAEVMAHLHERYREANTFVVEKPAGPAIVVNPFGVDVTPPPAPQCVAASPNKFGRPMDKTSLDLLRPYLGFVTSARMRRSIEKAFIRVEPGT